MSLRLVARVCVWLGMAGLVSVIAGLLLGLHKPVNIGTAVFAIALAAWAVLNAIVLIRPVLTEQHGQGVSGRLRHSVRVAGAVLLLLFAVFAVRLVFFMLE